MPFLDRGYYFIRGQENFLEKYQGKLYQDSLTKHIKMDKYLKVIIWKDEKTLINNIRNKIDVSKIKKTVSRPYE